MFAAINEIDKSENEEECDAAAHHLHSVYLRCLKEIGNENHSLDCSYNLLLTRNFLYLIRRSAEGVTEDGLTVTLNSLGFAGTLAVKREEDV